jgi:hypothetical protein
MNPNSKEIIVIDTIGNQQKQIVLSNEHQFSEIYHIVIDKEYQWQVLKMTGRWGVYPHKESWLKGENCDVILQAGLNAENSNS